MYARVPRYDRLMDFLKWAGKYVVGAFVLAVVIVAIVSPRGDKKKEEDDKRPADAPSESASAGPTTAKPAVRAEPPVEVTLPVFIRDYNANAIGADAKYRDKILRVTALVKRVGRNALDEPVVLLEFGKDGFRAKFANDAGLAGLKPSDTVVMRCRGGNDYGEPTLTECVLDK